jgi:hypothetical protein
MSGNREPLQLVDEGVPNEDGVGHISWAASNEEMFARILDLYGRPGMTIADVTYGKGVFWKLVATADYHLLTTDATMGVDARALPYDADSLDMLVFDPPYRYVERRTVNGHTHEQYQLESLRLEQRPGIDGVLDLYRDGIREAGRVVKHGGFIIVKCQDTAGDGKQTWMHDHVMGYCEASGFTPVDLAVVVIASPPPTRWKIQRTLKKAHSYFIVARKGGCYPFGYKSVQAR